MRNTVSVIIPNHNYARYLSTAIESVLNQINCNVDLIIVDNGSTDDSREVINGFSGELTSIFQDNLGQASARNTGLKHAKGNLIAFLDADDYWEPNKLEMQIEMLSDDCQFIYTAIRQFDSESGSFLGSIKPKFEGDCRFSYLKYPSTAIVPAGESSALMVHSLIEKVGLFDDRLNSATGRDFFRRCSNFTKFGYVDSDLVNYRIHNRNMSSNSQLMMQDSELAYDLLFADPEWDFAIEYRSICLAKLQWSHLKTNLKLRNPRGVMKSISKIITL